MPCHFYMHTNDATDEGKLSEALCFSTRKFREKVELYNKYFYDFAHDRLPHTQQLQFRACFAAHTYLLTHSHELFKYYSWLELG